MTVAICQQYCIGDKYWILKHLCFRFLFDFISTYDNLVHMFKQRQINYLRRRYLYMHFEVTQMIGILGVIDISKHTFTIRVWLIVYHQSTGG